MKYFLDTEFIETGETILLISIGIVDENDREYYAINADCDFSQASDWVKENVITQLPPKNPVPTEVSPSVWEQSKAWKSREEIAREVAEFLGCTTEITFPVRRGLLKYWDRFLANNFPGYAKKKYTFELKPGIEQPEIWGYYADYDWVVFCWLFGTMMDLPKYFPMYCRDLKQWCDELGNPRLPKQSVGEHNALADAKWNKFIWEFLDSFERELARLSTEENLDQQ